MIVRVAVPVPVHRLFDYLTDEPAPSIGARVQVRFGRRLVVGLVIDRAEVSEHPLAELKQVDAVLDASPMVSANIIALIRWLADYYQAPIGEVASLALPVALRRGAPAKPLMAEWWSLTESGRGQAPSLRGAVQQRLWSRLSDDACDSDTLAAIHQQWRARLKTWKQQGLVACREERVAPAIPSTLTLRDVPPLLNQAQQQAVDLVGGDIDRFGVTLLHGITGSGKTEVYLQLIAALLGRGRQALVLVPEIALTPQLVERFRNRLAVPIAVLHSGRRDSERLQDWLDAASGAARVVIGTRSALFTPLPQLGLIVIDEEHDTSLKQQDGVRYHARDVAVMRARIENVPVILGSATPSLESYHNAQRGRYRLIALPTRAGSAVLPAVHLLSLRELAVNDGLTHPLLQAVATRMTRGEQSLLFINRRGFAPVLWCAQCAWVATCNRCDARLAVHGTAARLLCHHCGAQQGLVKICPACSAQRLQRVGAGTERVETALAKLFPAARLLRIDSDTTAVRGELERRLEAARSGAVDILIGTQMLSKGHDFPNVTLVGVLDADQGLLSTDFRGPEQLFQQAMQVAGRAGRSTRSGEVFIQTRYPEHPLFQALRTHDYPGFATQLLHERQQAGYPPYRHFALLRAEAHLPKAALEFLRTAQTAARTVLGTAAVNGAALDVSVMDPLPSPMERRAGRYRAQLLLAARERGALHALLQAWLPDIERLPLARRVRWHIDVDPISMY